MPVDEDYVPPDPTAPSNPKGLPPKPGKLPDYAPIEIEGAPEHGNADLPSNIDPQSPIEIFSLFFDDFILEVLAKNTNAYAVSHQPATTLLQQRVWKPTSVSELKAFIAAHIWMGLHPEPAIEDYWNTDPTKGPLHLNLTSHMPRNRFQQLDRFFHISPPNDPSTFVDQSPFDKLEPLGEHLRERFKLFWSIGTHLTVDETIVRFMGRSKETVNIPSKPEPEGFKIWVLANNGYVLDYMHHARGTGPVDLDDFWPD